jgi:hypothetical protein
MSVLHDSVYWGELDGCNFDALLAQWADAFPQGGVLALVAEADVSHVERLQAACRHVGRPLVGAVFPALIVDHRFADRGALLVPLERMPAYVLAQGFDAESHAEVAARADRFATDLLAKLPDAPTGEPPFLALLVDGLLPTTASVLERLYVTLADRVRYIGANVGSETFRPMPCLFDAERLVQGAVLGLLLEGISDMALEHDYPLPKIASSATSTEGNRIINIDWRPAFDVYRELVRKQYGIEIDRENFYRYGVHFPFGIVRAQGEPLVRIPVSLEDDGSLHCIGEVPENAILSLIEAPSIDALRTGEHLAAALGGDGGEILLFYCAGRRLHLGDSAGQELELLAEAAGGARLLGALSLGEIGSPRGQGYPLFHNACMVGARF